MALSATVQSIMTRPVTGLASRGRSGQPVLGGYVPRQQSNASRQVRCTAEDGQKEESTPAATPPPPTTQSTPPPPRKARISTKFSDVLAFNGPAPERINGRLAMIGFTAAIAVEALNGEDLFAQISNGGIAWFVGTSAVLSLASLVPLLRGVNVEGEEDGFMTADAELWNGRLAMLGLVALAFTEYVKGGALV